jgi:Tfp pilus assembly ATPase PilU
MANFNGQPVDYNAKGVRSGFHLHFETRSQMVFGMAGMYHIHDLLNLVAREGAEELRLEPGRPPVMMLQGKLQMIDGGLLTGDEVAELFRSIATDAQQRELDQCGNLRFVFAAGNAARFNVTAVTQEQHLCLTVKNLGR